jgi:pyrroloquinoline quinone (PQQ) biosynthesis protein C
MIMTMTDRGMLYGGTARAFLTRLEHEIKEHPALDHAFLRRFAEEKLDRSQLVEFAIQHYMYSRFFVRNVAAVVSNVPDEHARSLLIQNMYEEIGEPLKHRDRAYVFLLEVGLVTPAQVGAALASVGPHGDVIEYFVSQGILQREVIESLVQSRTSQLLELTHPALFRRFLRSLGVSPEVVAAAEPLPETSQFVREFDAVCRNGHWLEAMGALGPGTESVVPRIYGAILAGIRRSGTVTPSDYVFWTIHVHCDEGHGENILRAIEPYLDRAENQQLVRRGVMRVLNARKIWFDALERMVFRPRLRITEIKQREQPEAS